MLEDEQNQASGAPADEPGPDEPDTQPTTDAPNMHPSWADAVLASDGQPQSDASGPDTDTMTRPEPPPAAPPPPTAPGPRRLTRSRDRKVGGVAGGLAEYFDIDPVITRLGFVLAVFAGGLGVAAYVIAWIVLPESDGPQPPRQSGDRSVDTTTVVALVLLAIAASAAIADSFDGGFVLPVVLVGAGVYLLTQRAEEQVPPVSQDPAQPGSPWAPPPAGSGYDQTSTAWDPTPAAAPPPRRPAIVTYVALSLNALLISGAIVADQAGWFDVDASVVVAIGLGIVGAALMVGAFVGRSRGLIGLGVLLTLAFSASAVLEPIVEDGVGERFYDPQTISELQPEYQLGIGELKVDLSQLEIPDGEEVTVKVVLGIGEASVTVPPLANLVLDGEVGVGDLQLLDVGEEGFGNELEVRRSFNANADLTVILEVGVGEGSVVRNG